MTGPDDRDPAAPSLTDDDIDRIAEILLRALDRPEPTPETETEQPQRPRPRCEVVPPAGGWPVPVRSCVYFVRFNGAAEIKIGVSKNPQQRMTNFSRAERIDVLALLPGDRTTEREMHERFAHLRARKTETFAPGADLLAFIEGVRATGATR